MAKGEFLGLQGLSEVGGGMAQRDLEEENQEGS